MDIILIILTIFITVLGNFFYIVSIFRGQTKPHIFSWFLWAIVQTIGCIIQLQHGASWGALTLGLNAIICVFVSVMTPRYGEKHITLLDTISFLLALCILPLWLLAKQDLLAILLALTIDVLSYVPTARKSFYKPSEENIGTYLGGAFAFVMSIALAKEKTLITLLYAITIICMDAGFMGYLLWRRKIIKK